MATAAELKIVIQGDESGAASAIGAVRAQLATLGEGMKTAAEKTGLFEGGLARTLQVAGGFAVFSSAQEAIGQFREAVQEAVGGMFDLEEATHKLVLTTGMGVEEASAMIGAAKEWGINSDQLTRSLTFLERQVGTNVLAAEAGGTGVKKFSQAMHELGIETTTATGQQKDLETLFLDVADAVSKSTDEYTVALLATTAFGRGTGTELIPFLKLGKAGLEELTQAQKDYGNVLTEESLPRIHNIAMIQKDATAAWDGAKLSLVEGLIPALKTGASTLDTLAGAFAREHRVANTATDDFIDLTKETFNWGAALDYAGRVLGGVAEVAASTREVLTVSTENMFVRMAKDVGVGLADIGEARQKSLEDLETAIKRQNEIVARTRDPASGLPPNAADTDAAAKHLTDYGRKWQDFYIGLNKQSTDYTAAEKDRQDSFNDYVRTTREALSKHLASIQEQEAKAAGDYWKTIDQLQKDYLAQTKDDTQKSADLQQAITLYLLGDRSSATADADYKDNVAKKKAIDDKLAAEKEAQAEALKAVWDAFKERRDVAEKEKTQAIADAKEALDRRTDDFNDANAKAYGKFQYEREQSALTKSRLVEDTTAVGLAFDETTGHVDIMAKAVKDLGDAIKELPAPYSPPPGINASGGAAAGGAYGPFLPVSNAGIGASSVIQVTGNVTIAAPLPGDTPPDWFKRWQDALLQSADAGAAGRR